jgi:hypothetical protein
MEPAAARATRSGNALRRRHLEHGGTGGSIPFRRRRSQRSSSSIVVPSRDEVSLETEAMLGRCIVLNRGERFQVSMKWCAQVEDGRRDSLSGIR